MKIIPFFKFSKITEELDKILAILGVIVGLILIFTLIFFLQETSFQYITSPIMLFLACAIFLLVRSRASEISHLEKLNTNCATIRVLNILFIILFSYSIFTVAINPQPYSRPLGYFISISMLTVILAIEIIFFAKKGYMIFILLKIILTASLLIIIPRLLFPDLIGIDPYSHRWFTMSILEQHHIPEGWGYSKLPVMHLIIGFTSLITNLDYKTSTMLSIDLFQVISLIFIFLIGKLIYGSKAGLLATLSLAIGPHFIRMGFSVRPITLGVIIISFLIYMLFRKNDKFPLAPLILIMFATLILTHTIASLYMSFFLFSFWFGFELFKKIYHDKSKIPVTLSLSILFTVAMLGWWMYASGHITMLASLIKWGLEKDTWETPAITTKYLERYKLEYILNTFGFNFYCFFSIIGLLYMLSRKFGNKYSFTLAHGGVMMTGIIFFSLVSGKSGLFAPRWYPGLEVILAVPVAIGLLVICGFLKKRVYKVLVLSILILVLSFFTITSPVANIDTPIYSKNTAIRYSLTNSEIQSANTILNIYNGEIKTDSFYNAYFFGLNTTTRSLTSNLISGEYANINSLIIIREEIVERPFYIEHGSFKLDYDPREKLNNVGFNLIYNSGEVSAFLKR